MDANSEYNIKHKLPQLIYSLFDYHTVEVITADLGINEKTLLSWVAAEKFPTHNQLKCFCERFKFDYNTLKTWRLHERN